MYIIVNCLSEHTRTTQGRIQDFKLGGAHLKKLPRPEGGAKIFGVFRVKNHDFTTKNHIFSNFRGGVRGIFGVFRVKNHDCMPRNHIFSNFRGARAGCTPPGSAPATVSMTLMQCHFDNSCSSWCAGIS